MTSPSVYPSPEDCRRSRKRTRPSLLAVLCALWLASGTVGLSSGVVTTTNEANLRSAVAGGGLVTFACDGTITLSESLSITSDTTIDGSSHNLTISGSNAVRVFFVNPGVSFQLKSITVANGCTNMGAGLYNANGMVNISNCTFSGNSALGSNGVPQFLSPPAGSAYGGAIYNDLGSLVVLGSRFLTNRAQGGVGSEPYPSGDGGASFGGAIYNSGALWMTNCLFEFNSSLGGTGGGIHYWGGYGFGGSAWGGGLYSTNGSVQSSNCIFRNNQTVGAFSGEGQKYIWRGNAFGGGVWNAGPLEVVRGTILSNTAVGQSAFGGGVHHASGDLVMADSIVIGNTLLGDKQSSYYGSPGGPASGGGLFNAGRAWIRDTTFSSNQVTGGTSKQLDLLTGGGGPGLGGGVNNTGLVEIARCTFSANIALGGTPPRHSGSGGWGGEGYGGAIFSSGGEVRIVNSTLALNRALGGAGGELSGTAFDYPSSGGSGTGGAIYASNSPVLITYCTIADNMAAGGLGYAGPSGQGFAGAIFLDGADDALQNTIAALNTPDDVVGTFAGNNNLIARDPRLQPLADNGGPTLTMALMPDSPAIDVARSLSAVDTDQRGAARPYGSGPDIGAYEWAGTCIPHAATAVAQVVNGFVVGGTITEPGCGYTNAPEIQIIGTGSGAAAVATAENGIITLITIRNPGSGYSTNTVLRVASPFFPPALGIAVAGIKVKLTLHVMLDKVYVIEGSHDLEAWTELGQPFTAQEEVIVQEFDFEPLGRYFRIRQVSP